MEPREQLGKTDLRLSSWINFTIKKENKVYVPWGDYGLWAMKADGTEQVQVTQLGSGPQEEGRKHAFHKPAPYAVLFWPNAQPLLVSAS